MPCYTFEQCPTLGCREDRTPYLSGVGEYISPFGYWSNMVERPIFGAPKSPNIVSKHYLLRLNS